jgi:hypothetical protein
VKWHRADWRAQFKKKLFGKILQISESVGGRKGENEEAKGTTA